MVILPNCENGQCRTPRGRPKQDGLSVCTIAHVRSDTHHTSARYITATCVSLLFKFGFSILLCFPQTRDRNPYNRLLQPYNYSSLRLGPTVCSNPEKLQCQDSRSSDRAECLPIQGPWTELRDRCARKADLAQ